jgi:hypothetical protein
MTRAALDVSAADLDRHRAGHEQALRLPESDFRYRRARRIEPFRSKDARVI